LGGGYSSFILVDEPTLEGIHRTFREGRPSLGLFNDEGGQFIGGHGKKGGSTQKCSVSPAPSEYV
jgi:hypothetical protein